MARQNETQRAEIARSETPPAPQVQRAKARTRIETDTDLIEFALANIALEDRFAESFKAVRGRVDPDLKLGF